MGLKWRSLLFYAGIVLLVQSACSDAARVPKTSARSLAAKTGAAHYEERSSEEGLEHQLRKRQSDEDFDYEVYQGVVGRPGIDFPILPRIPQTTFSCRTFGNGYFADLETECQVFHICDDGRKISFLCPNGTIFQQSELICDWWFKVNCPASPGHYAESAEMLSKAQGGHKRPSYTKKVENEFHSNGDGYSRSPFSDKSQYPIKKDNRRFEDSPDRVTQGTKKGHRFQSDEIPSLENFDFEDISDNRHESGKLKTARPDPSDGEMQDVAETASFVGNGQRRNGYNYDTLHEGQKPYDDRKGYDRTKSGRGRQKYRGDATKPPRGRNQNLGEGPEDNLFTSKDRATTARGSVTNKFEGDTTPGLIHQKRPSSPTAPSQTTRDRAGSHTTPRRLDNSRTTPYYTPTVPTIRATQTSTGPKTEFGVFPATTGAPSGISVSKNTPTASGGNVAFGGNAGQPQSISGDGNTGVAGSVSISGSGQPNNGGGISSTFAVSGPPAVTIPPHDHSFESQKTGPGSTSSGAQGLPAGTVAPLKNSFESWKNGSPGTEQPIQDSTGYSYQTPSKPSQNQFFGSVPTPLRPSQAVTSGSAGARFTGSPEYIGSGKIGAETSGSNGLGLGGAAQIQVSPALSQGGGATTEGGYAYKTPSKQAEGAAKPGASVQIQSTQGRFDPSRKNTDEKGNVGLSGSSSGSPGISSQTTSAPSLSQRGGASGNANLSGGAQGYVGIDTGLGGDSKPLGGKGNGAAHGLTGIHLPTNGKGTGIPDIGNIGITGKGVTHLPTIGKGTAAPQGGGLIITGTDEINSPTLGGGAATSGSRLDGQVSSTSPTLFSTGQTIPSGSQYGTGTGGSKPGASFSGGSSSSTPLVIGMRGTIPTDPTHKGADSSSPVIAVNVLSGGAFGGKISGPSVANSVQGSVLGGSSVKATTFKPYTSSSTHFSKGSTANGHGTFSASTYSPRDATTIQPSSGGPTYLPKPTKPSQLPESVSEHVDEMIKTLTDLKDGKSLNNRIGLEIPPSSGPETLHSLALYFAGEGDNASTTTETGEPTATIKADINAAALSNKTVQQYEALFGLGSTTEKATDTTFAPDFQPNLSRNSNDLEAQHSNNLLGGAGGKGETRKIAQVFTNALSAYLEDPDSFRKVLTEVRPTEPPGTDENEVTTQGHTTNAYFNKGTAATYLPTTPTTILPSTTTEDLEVLDFSDVTISTGQRAQTAFPDSTAASTTESSASKGGLNRIPALSLDAARKDKLGKNLRGDDSTSNQIAVEINKGLGLSTAAPYSLQNSGKTGLPRGGSVAVGTSITPGPEGTTTNLPLTFDLLPPVGGGKPSNLGPPSSDILPPGYDDDEDTLQRAQSQSFVASRNRLGKGNSGKPEKGSKSATKTPGHYITRPVSGAPTTTEYPEAVSPWFLDPLTINDGLMDEFRTTTASPHTYLPKVTSSTTETSPVHLDLSSVINRIQLTDSKADRLGKALPGIPEDLLPPENGMQRIANKVFGNLNESSANHLMNVMKKAEDNPTVRRLILLLIQTCGDDDYSKTVEQSRQVLLNALIGMDENLGLEDEVEVIRLRPRQSRRGKSIGDSDRNSLTSSTTEYPVTTFKRDISAYTASTENPGSTTQNPLDETTRFEIRVEDPEEVPSTTTSDSDVLNFSTTTTRPGQETTPSYSTSDSSASTISPLNSGDVSRAGSRRTAKDVETSLSQPSLSHKSSDERALELLKSLYSLASKFGRR